MNVATQEPGTADVRDDAAGTIVMNDNQELVIQPDTDRLIGGQCTLANYNNGISNIGGLLRLQGGTTTVYAANDNHPTTTVFNNFDG